jgi:hypothetical protein
VIGHTVRIANAGADAMANKGADAATRQGFTQVPNFLLKRRALGEFLF